MIDFLPAESQIVLRATPDAAQAMSLERADGAIFVLDAAAAERALEALPCAPLWHKLYRRARESSATPLLVTRLPNDRATLVAVGFLREDASGFQRLELAGRLARAVLEPGVVRLQTRVPGFAEPAAVAMHEALLSAALHTVAPMPSLKRKPPPPSALARIDIAARLPRGLLQRASAIAGGNHLARWLTALPPNLLDSRAYREVLRRLARREGWSFRFYDEAALRRLGAGAFLAVSRANAHRGAGIVRLRYRPRKGAAVRPLALVGKGICFDTGGVNIKSHKGMYQMHGDMQGSAVALGTLLALTRQQAGYPIDCWLALTENQTGPDAYRPQEVVTACNGVSIQVVHSDAEGRMVLADTLALAAREKPRLILDYATLTGACLNALTERYSGVFTNRPRLQSLLQEVGRASGERVWCFPMDDDFDAELESPIADVLQCLAEGKGDHILAARFLNRFVPQQIPWVHMDLSAAERKGGLAHVPTEFTGFGVRYTAQLLERAELLPTAKAL